MPDAFIICSCKARIIIHLYPSDGWIGMEDPFTAVITRSIVHHNDLEDNFRRMLIDCAQAIQHEVRAFIIDDDDG